MMRRNSKILFLAFMFVASLTAVENDNAHDAGPATAQFRPTNRSGPNFPRPLPAFEVEMMTVKSGDEKSLAAWAQLAAVGYHTVGAVPNDGGVVLYLERSSGQSGATPLQLPAQLERDPVAADALRAAIRSLQEQRQKMLVAPATGSVPAVMPPVQPLAPAVK